MRRRLGVATLLALLASACLAPAAGASLQPPSPQARQLRALALRLAARQGEQGRQPVSLQSNLELDADGYRVAVEGFGGDVAVEVAKEGRHGEALSAYLVRGTVTRGRLRAKIGDLGRISMRFRQGGGHSVNHPKTCHGRHRFLVRHGVFAGSFRFRGEGGYLDFTAHRAKGTVREVAPRCLGSRSGSGPSALAGVPHTRNVSQKPERAYLYASSQHGVSSASVLALKNKKGKTELVASQETIRGTMAIIRAATVTAGPKSLRANDALTRARLSAPAPFGGAGSFAASADGASTWEGGLSVDFPGLDGFSLTGSEYATQIGRTADPLFLFFLLSF